MLCLSQNGPFWKGATTTQPRMRGSNHSVPQNRLEVLVKCTWLTAYIPGASNDCIPKGTSVFASVKWAWKHSPWLILGGVTELIRLQSTHSRKDSWWQVGPSQWWFLPFFSLSLPWPPVLKRNSSFHSHRPLLWCLLFYFPLSKEAPVGPVSHPSTSAQLCPQILIHPSLPGQPQASLPWVWRIGAF